MIKSKNSHFIITKNEQVTITRIQDGMTIFKENPSDEYKFGEKKDVISNSRISAYELFSLFTADIIKEEVIFTR